MAKDFHNLYHHKHLNTCINFSLIDDQIVQYKQNILMQKKKN